MRCLDAVADDAEDEQGADHDRGRHALGDPLETILDAQAQGVGVTVVGAEHF
jgi:hypothetical protein